MRLLFALCFSVLCVGALPAQGSAQTIPTLHGELLSGEPLDLPGALKGHDAILVLGFSQAARPQVTAWGRLLAGDYRNSPTVLYYEMPVLAAVPRLLRPWVLKQVKAGVPDRAKGHCVPVLDHEKEWKQLAGFAQEDDAYLLLVDSHGVTQWAQHGAADDAAYARLKEHLAGLKPT